MSNLASLLIRVLGWKSARQFDVATRDPTAIQLRKLRRIVRQNQDTEYGREYDFRAVNTVDDWRVAVPVVNYEDIKTRIERVTRGEKNVLTAEDPVMFARTSGTTGDAKFIPVTPTCQGREQKDQMRTWFFHAIRAHPTIFKGSVVSLVSPAVEGFTPAGIPFGSTSGHIYKNMPGLVRGTYLVPYEVFEVGDYETKYYVVMRLGIGSDVSLVGTANPSSIIKMCELASHRADELLKDLHDGTLTDGLELSGEVRGKVLARCRPDPERARRLEAARSRRGGKLLPADYWPNLALIGCWKGGTVGAYVDRFPAWFDPQGEKPVPVRDWGYLSSEARGSVPVSDEGSGGVLTVATNFYEFVAVNELENKPDDRRGWNFLGVEEVEQGREYYVFLTTTGGLYRYDINDVVEVVGFYHRTPVVSFRRKGRGVTNITGEKVSVNQVIAAFGAAQKEVGVVIEHFKAEALLGEERYVFLAESTRGIPPERRRALLASLERNLASLNIEYAAKRKSRRLRPPVLHVMKPGWYDAGKKERAAAGKRAFQDKTILLSAGRIEPPTSWLEAIVGLE